MNASTYFVLAVILLLMTFGRVIVRSGPKGIDWALEVAFIRLDFPPEHRDVAQQIAAGLAEIVGMKIKQRAARYSGVALLGVTLAKLFLHDLNDLDELYRIGAFVSVALILIAASFIYQRFLVPEQATK